ncbi:putative heat shock 22 kDa protein [Sesbania bispinosa]|nr:putative heat shock 22 kDa protein [Sesbania bispinosa]
MFAVKAVNPFAKKRLSQHGVVSSATPNTNSKKLWRLPHVFAKMLELPFPSDADVLIEETTQFFRFVASCNNNINMFNAGGGVRAHAIEILPGITKIVIKRMDGGDVAVAGQQHPRFGVDLWRFRLPQWTQPEKVTAVCSAGKLVVTVPKSRGN